MTAYSRGAAVAKHSPGTPDTTYLAPAFGREYGVGTNVSGPGRIYHGGNDRFVPLKNSCEAAQSSGMDLYVSPDRGHGGVLGDYKSGRISGYRQLSQAEIDNCVAGLESWGSNEYPGKEDPRVKRQNDWTKVPKNEAKEVALRNLIRKSIKNYK